MFGNREVGSKQMFAFNLMFILCVAGLRVKTNTVHWVTSIFVGNSISKLQIHVATYDFELSAGNCHR
jgi:hypothetical protein